MASIIKRRKKFSVVYRYTDENGNERQKWESFDTMAEAKKRKLEVEFKQENNEFIAPTMKTLNDLMASMFRSDSEPSCRGRICSASCLG